MISGPEPSPDRFAPVPLIDISAFRDGDPARRAAVARTVGDALEGIGFMMITTASRGTRPPGWRMAAS
jgi:isopenicillin N synthase-like dioxygenase